MISRQMGITLMGSPVVKRQTLPRSGFLPFFFRCGSGRASFASGNVFCLHCRRLVPPGGCTTHLSRVSRHDDGECREPGDGFLRPRNLSVPSYRPPQTRGYTSPCASEAEVRGRGSPQAPSATSALGRTGASAGVSANAPGQGTGPMCAEACVDARSPA